MQVVEKFIINRDNMQYMYVEALLGNFGNKQFHVFHNTKNYEIKSPEDFSVTYGNNEYLPLYAAINNMDNDVVEVYDRNALILLNNLKLLKEKFKNSNKWNPSLWGYRETLLSSIDSYNNILDKREKIEEYDYEREYDRLTENDIDDLLERIRNHDNVA